VFFRSHDPHMLPHLDKEYLFLPRSLQMKPSRSRGPTGDTWFSPLPNGFRHREGVNANEIAKQEKGLRGYGIGRSCDPSGYGNRGL
jgi:hypothetical protein